MKFRFKIVISMLCLLSLLFGIGGSLLISLSCSDSLGREKDAAFRSYQLVASMLQALGMLDRSADEGAMARILDQLARQNPSWTALTLSSEAETLYAYGSAGDRSARKGMDYSANRCQITLIQEGSAYRLFLSGNFPVSGNRLFLDMTYDVTGIYETRGRQQTAYRGIFAAMLALCAALSYSIVWAITRPLSRLSRATKQLAAGNLQYRLKITSGDEVGQVAADFNRMAQRLENSVDDLRESLERQNRFIGSFAHEMKTPMTSVIGYAELLRGGALEAEESREAANYIFSEGKRLERLSNKLLELLVTRQSDFALKEVDIARLIDRTMAAQKPVFQREQIDLQWECAPGLCRVEPDLFSSLLLNLTDNARKATERGGSVRLFCAMLPDGCRLRVVDNGRGIPEAALSHLEEAFYRVDKARSRMQGGAGLGLALCHEIVRLHHGTLRFESKEGCGTSVTAELRGGRT